VVYELTPSGGGWTEKVVHDFQGGNDGLQPTGGVIFDRIDNLDGVTIGGGPGGYGTVYQLSPSGSGWIEKTLYAWFIVGHNGAGGPIGGLLMDPSGNLYGTCPVDNVPMLGWYGGIVYELAYLSWNYNVLFKWISDTDVVGPLDKLSMDAAGNLYGTTVRDGAYSEGSVFELSTTNGWYTELYDFTGGSDGARPMSIVIMDANGNLYGTTVYGGSSGNGVVWEITP
jgi:uncharacterized repeat protein (TIGR03803 family)